MPYTTVEEAVQEGADAFAQAEEYARDVKDRFRGLKEVFEYLTENTDLGALESLALSSACDECATNFEARLYELHSMLTRRAGELGIDLPAMRGGNR